MNGKNPVHFPAVVARCRAWPPDAGMLAARAPAAAASTTWARAQPIRQPPINPASIKKTFDEPTVDDWQTPFAKVNAFIRTQPHIDIAAAFPLDPGMTPALALDGLHGDVVAKQRMAAVINEHIRDFVKEPMALPENQTEETKENTNAAKTSLLPD